MKKLGERTAVVRCRQVDLAAVRDSLEPARKNYAAVFGEEAPSLTLDQKDFLPPPPTNATDETNTWCADCNNMRFSAGTQLHNVC